MAVFSICHVRAPLIFINQQRWWRHSSRPGGAWPAQLGRWCRVLVAAALPPPLPGWLPPGFQRRRIYNAATGHRQLFKAARLAGLLWRDRYAPAGARSCACASGAAAAAACCSPSHARLHRLSAISCRKAGPWVPWPPLHPGMSPGLCRRQATDKQLLSRRRSNT